MAIFETRARDGAVDVDDDGGLARARDKISFAKRREASTMTFRGGARAVTRRSRRSRPREREKKYYHRRRRARCGVGGVDARAGGGRPMARDGW